MTRRVVSHQATIEAPQQVVWDLLGHADGWSTWAGFATSKLEREGTPERDGVGAIRNFGVGKILSREEVTEFDAPNRFSYRLLSGLPIRDYHSTVTLRSIDEARTHVTWASSFDNDGPKSLVMKGFIAVTLRNITRRLARYAPKVYSGEVSAP